MERSQRSEIISLSLILMFTYAAMSKLFKFGLFRVQLDMQPFPEWSVPLLAYAIPILELLTVVALLFKQTKSFGLYAAATLMAIFTLYAVLAVFGLYAKIPCACGGILGRLSWSQHLLFNLIFLVISIYGIILNYRERRIIGK